MQLSNHNQLISSCVLVRELTLPCDQIRLEWCSIAATLRQPLQQDTHFWRNTLKQNLALCGLLLAFSFPGLAQTTPAPAAATAMTVNADSADYSALREKLAARNKELNDQVNMQRAVVKKNEELLKEAQKLDASNKKLEAEKQMLEKKNQDLERQRDALKAAQAKTDTASEAPAAPAK